MTAKVYFTYGTMNSGKSMELLKIIHTYEEQNKRIFTMKPTIDNRNLEKPLSINTRAGEYHEIDFPLKENWLLGIENTAYSLEDLRRQVTETHYDVMLVDEAQFLSEKMVDNLVEIAETVNTNIMFFGLRVDFQTHLFPGSKRLLEIADDIREMKTICHYCNHKATLNLRVDDHGNAVSEGQQVQIGGNESYIATCRDCYYRKHRESRFAQCK